MKKFSFEVKISLKKGILDTQGMATEKVLKRMGYVIDSINFGKDIKFEIEANDKEEALKSAEKISHEVLTNPVLETYELNMITTEGEA
ncbi:MAG: phosphoribosylformylglycinamidine synthase subunit PurS [Thermotogota bacterium]